MWKNFLMMNRKKKNLLQKNNKKNQKGVVLIHNSFLDGVKFFL